jgi:hypothetical protein
VKFALALAIALNFWGARGVDVPCTPVAVSGADAQLPSVPFPGTLLMQRADMAAVDCRVLLSNYAAYLRRTEPDYYCAEVVHEVGHIAGLEHHDDGVMNARLEENRIWDCAHWKAFARRHGIPLGRRHRP